MYVCKQTHIHVCLMRVCGSPRAEAVKTICSTHEEQPFQRSTSNHVLTHAAPSTRSRTAGFAAGIPSTRGKLTTATTPVTAQRGSGAARISFVAAKDEPPPTSHGRRGVGKGKRHALPNRLRPVWTRTFQRLPAPRPTSPRKALLMLYCDWGHVTTQLQ